MAIDMRNIKKIKLNGQYVTKIKKTDGTVLWTQQATKKKKGK